MKKTVGFFAGLSLGINGSKTNIYQNHNLESLSPEDRTKIIQLLNHHHSLFENLNDLDQNSGLKTEFNQNIREQYARFYEQLDQKIDQQQSVLSTQEKFADRYENLFNKYDQKLRNNNLTTRQRMRYHKLWIQYGMLYVQYCHN